MCTFLSFFCLEPGCMEKGHAKSTAQIVAAGTSSKARHWPK